MSLQSLKLIDVDVAQSVRRRKMVCMDSENGGGGKINPTDSKRAGLMQKKQESLCAAVLR